MKTFRFQVLDLAERAHPALVVIDDDWPGATSRNQVVNVAADDWLQLDVTFRATEIEVTVVPLRVEGGEVTKLPRDRREAELLTNLRSDVRRLRIDDPTEQLFVLARINR